MLCVVLNAAQCTAAGHGKNSANYFLPCILPAEKQESVYFCAAKLGWLHRTFLISLFASWGKQLSIRWFECHITSPALCIFHHRCHHTGRNSVMVPLISCTFVICEGLNLQICWGTSEAMQGTGPTLALLLSPEAWSIGKTKGSTYSCI